MKRISCFAMIAVLLAGACSGCGTQAAPASVQEVPEASVAVMESASAAMENSTPEPETESETGVEASDLEMQSNSAVEVETPSILQYDEDGYEYIDFSTAPDNTETYPLKNAEGITLTYWGGGPNLQAPISAWEENLVYAEIMKATGVNIEFVSVAGPTLSENMNLLLASGDYPDIFGEGLGNYAAGYSAVVDDGIVVDLSRYLEEYSPNYHWLREKLPEFRNLGTTDSGYVVGYLPLIVNYSGNSGGLCIRKDWLDAMGMELPTTYDELEAALLGMKNAGYTVSPMAMLVTGEVSNNALCAGYDISLSLFMGGGLLNNLNYDENNTLVYSVTSDNAKEYLTMLNRWYMEGLFGPELRTNGVIISSDVLSDSYGVWFDNGDFMDSYAEQAATLGQEMFVTAIVDPTIERGDTITIGRGDPIALNANSYYNSVSTCCDSPEIAVSVIDYMYSEAGQLLSSYGVEGMTYTIENGYPSYTDLILNNPEGLTRTNAMTKYLMPSPGYFGDNRGKMEQMYSQNLAESYDRWISNQEASRDDNISHFTLTQEESSVVSSALTDAETYASECYGKFIVGDMNLETEWEAFVDTMNAFGLEQVMEVANAAAARFDAR